MRAFVLRGAAKALDGLSDSIRDLATALRILEVKVSHWSLQP